MPTAKRKKAKSLLRQTRSLNKALSDGVSCSRKSASTFSPSIRNLQQRIIELYEQIIYLDPDFACKHEVELNLWKYGFRILSDEYRIQIKRHVVALSKKSKGREEKRKNLNRLYEDYKAFLTYGRRFYKELVSKLQMMHDLKLDGSVRFLFEDDSVAEEEQAESICSTNKSYLICHRSMIYMGDLARYHRDLRDSAASETWRTAEIHYQQALRLIPEIGNPYNQLAVLATYDGNQIKAAYCYTRSLALEYPFDIAKANLSGLYQKAKVSLAKQLDISVSSNVALSWSRKTPASQRKDQLELFRTKFVHLHGTLFHRTDLDGFFELCEQVISTLGEILGSSSSVGIGTTAAAEAIHEELLDMFVIAIFSLHITAVEYKDNKEEEEENAEKRKKENLSSTTPFPFDTFRRSMHNKHANSDKITKEGNNGSSGEESESSSSSGVITAHDHAVDFFCQLCGCVATSLVDKLTQALDARKSFPTRSRQSDNSNDHVFVSPFGAGLSPQQQIGHQQRRELLYRASNVAFSGIAGDGSAQLLWSAGRQYQQAAGKGLSLLPAPGNSEYVAGDSKQHLQPKDLNFPELMVMSVVADWLCNHLEVLSADMLEMGPWRQLIRPVADILNVALKAARETSIFDEELVAAPLEEERELRGFLPLKKAYKQVEFAAARKTLGTAESSRLRLHKFIKLGRSLRDCKNSLPRFDTVNNCFVTYEDSEPPSPFTTCDGPATATRHDRYPKNTTAPEAPVANERKAQEDETESAEGKLHQSDSRTNQFGIEVYASDSFPSSGGSGTASAHTPMDNEVAQENEGKEYRQMEEHNQHFYGGPEFSPIDSEHRPAEATLYAVVNSPPYSSFADEEKEEEERKSYEQQEPEKGKETSKEGGRTKGTNNDENGPQKTTCIGSERAETKGSAISFCMPPLSASVIGAASQGRRRRQYQQWKSKNDSSAWESNNPSFGSVQRYHSPPTERQQQAAHQQGLSLLELDHQYYPFACRRHAQEGYQEPVSSSSSLFSPFCEFQFRYTKKRAVHTSRGAEEAQATTSGSAGVTLGGTHNPYIIAPATLHVATSKSNSGFMPSPSLAEGYYNGSPCDSSPLLSPPTLAEDVSLREDAVKQILNYAEQKNLAGGTPQSNSSVGTNPMSLFTRNPYTHT